MPASKIISSALVASSPGKETVGKKSMDKAQSFRDHIPAHVEELKQNPDKFSVFIGNGNVVARDGSASFEYRYEIQALITDYPHHPDTIFLPLILWVAVNQPSLLQNPDKAENDIKFEAEPINNKDYDIHITFP